ncbi:TetR/AcrR family transcriptional regulator [Francisella sp. SYW-9]|uniref:TetR/AcrR family transcriptional regulator n=1 Tax=Francisella sp. SYW-9 TaxID=2610888 RepID=UPI00123DAA69|nr:TetR/AcrR family transcriptional regulator [Francisella sp. SYW-9]
MTAAKKESKAEETKKEILQAAYKIAKDEGFHAISSIKIIKTCGFSKGKFFHYFPKIEDLYLYILDCFIKQTSSEVVSKKEPTLKKFENLKNFINDYIDYFVNLLKESPEYAALIFYFVGHCQHNKKYRAKFNNIIQTSLDEWTANFPAKFTPSLSKEGKQRLLHLLDTYIIGLCFNYLIIKDDKVFETTVNDFKNVVFHFFDSQSLDKDTIESN